MATIQFNEIAFRASFPQLASNPSLQAFWDTATLYVNDQTGGCYTGGLTPAQQTWALNLMTAHLVALSNMLCAGETPGFVQSATVDNVSVTLTPPPQKNQWEWWLNTTPYGAQLLTLLSIVSVGGLYIGGRPELAAFRRPGGFW